MTNLCKEFPKVELHVHLEGSTSAKTLIELARTGRTPHTLPTLDEKTLQEKLICRDLKTFWNVWKILKDLWLDPENLAVMTRSYLEEAAKMKVCYVEINTGFPRYTQMNGRPLQPALEAIHAARKEAFANWGIRSSVSFGFNRGFPKSAMENAKFAVKAKEKGMVQGMVLLGDEAKFSSLTPFKKAVDYIKDAGLFLTAHAGEWAGPESIWNTLKQLSPHRIGHGVRAWEDPELVEHLRKEEIHLEVCPTSNICTGVYDSLAKHPLRKMFEAGLKLSVNSDDPPLFGTSIGAEYELLATTFGFTPQEIATIALNGVTDAFLAKEEKEILRQEVIAGYQTLGILV